MSDLKKTCNCSRCSKQDSPIKKIIYSGRFRGGGSTTPNYNKQGYFNPKYGQYYNKNYPQNYQPSYQQSHQIIF